MTVLLRPTALSRFLLVSSLIVSSTVLAKRKCDFPCRNKGICRERDGVEAMYCQCPAGFAGAFCEIQYNVCESADQVCSNGRKCQRAVDDFAQEYFHCECDPVRSDLSFDYADKLCAHASTVFCREDDDTEQAKKDRKSLGEAAGGSFCTNGGVCREEVDDGKNHHHAGCDCPKGYTGNHCEHSLEVKKHPAKTVEFRTSSRSWLRTFFMFLIFSVGFMMCGLAFMIHHGNRGRQTNRQQRAEIERAKTPVFRDQPEIEVT